MAPADDTGSQDDAAAASGGEAVIAALQAENGLLRSEITSLMLRIAELERRLGLNSSNSGQPPSSDGLKKPPRVSSLREPSGKKTGGQKGHRGETLRRTEKPAVTIEHYPPTCTTCGAMLTAAEPVGVDGPTASRARLGRCQPRPEPSMSQYKRIVLRGDQGEKVRQSG
jgi:transposase